MEWINRRGFLGTATAEKFVRRCRAAYEHPYRSYENDRTVNDREMAH